MSLESVKQKVLEQIDAEEIITLLSKAIKCRSICEEEGAEKETAKVFADYWRKIGLEVESPEVEKDRPNVYGTLEGVGGGPKFMLGGHLDTEPIVYPEKWKHDPFSGDIDREGGWVYGLGTVNMKQSIAAFTGATHAIIKAGVKLKGTLILAGWMNEDGGDIGSRYMADHGPIPDMCVIGEPTECKILTTHSGAMDFTITTRGVAGHITQVYTNRPGFARTVNAFDKMMKLIKELKDVRKTFTFERHPTIGDPVMNVGKVVTESISIGLRPAEAPHICKANLDIRYLPSMTVQSIVKDIERVFLNLWVEDPDFEATIEVWPRSYNLPPPEVPRDSRVVQIVANAHREVFNEEVAFVDEETPYRYYWTDACVLNGILKIPTINYGPAGGEGSVIPDERVSIPQLIAAAKVYALTALEACGVK